jgi:uncharacterized protein (DUF58 family)
MLTKRGLMVLGLMVAAFVIADAADVRILYLLFAGLALLFLLSYLQIRRTPRNLKVVRSISKNPCIEGELLEVEMDLFIKGGISGMVVSFEDRIPEGLSVDRDQKATVWRDGHTKVVYRLRPERRGEYGLGPFEVGVSDLFGLMVSRRDVGEPSRILVYPGYSVMEMTGGERVSEALGVKTTNKRGTSSDFLRIRQYEPGDEVKIIHWKSSAKLDRLMVRELEREETRSVTVILDCRDEWSGTGSAGFESGVRAAASVAVSALRDNIDAELILNGEDKEVVPRGRGSVQYHRILSALARVKTGGRSSLSYLLDNLARKRGSKGSLYLIAPRVREKDLDALAHLVGRGYAPFVILPQAESGLTHPGYGREIRFGSIRDGRRAVAWIG